MIIDSTGEFTEEFKELINSEGGFTEEFGKKFKEFIGVYFKYLTFPGYGDIFKKTHFSQDLNNSCVYYLNWRYSSKKKQQG